MNLTPREADILEALDICPSTGAEIIQKTGIKQGTVYPGLRLLDKRGFVVRSDDQGDTVYRLTKVGLGVLKLYRKFVELTSGSPKPSFAEMRGGKKKVRRSE